MTVFIMVAGVFTGAHVWQETAARLTAAGSEVHAVRLTGVDAGRPAASARVDLETHIADVIAAIDAVDAVSGRGIVLVGHDYGIHPVLGAADRRPQRIARVVYLDCGMPQNGLPALAAVPDQAVRAHLAERADRGETDGELAPPDRDVWQRWGSTAGVSDAALDRLTALAAPQPLGTLLQPLRLTGAVAAVPTTGVLCTGNGVGIDLVQRLVDFGDPVSAALADPRVTFFELPTGHWPMLSCPAELADVLLRAAAGEGHRLRPADGGAPPAHLRPFPIDVPELPRDRRAHVDLYVPEAEGPRPAVVFVHGGPVPAGARPTPRDWPTLVGYARLAAAAGLVGVTLDHRLHDVGDYGRAAADVTAAVELVRADPRVDADRVALWFFSGAGLLTADWLTKPPAWLRCLAASYPILAPLPNWGLAGSRFHPVRAVAHAGALPVVLLRAGRETAEIAATVEAFVTAAEDCGARLELVDVPNGHHGFETLDAPEEVGPALRHAMRSVATHLAG
ncbi:alpha/beta hydrolase [Streptomyces calvus]|uniref:Pimeloyl-ACP methyl ester carboxylesterase n=1 Tax=Streptomyces calvus TaxID=67282 RepID=A0AA40SD75_9ACTN|nr:alpha/beta hydrolase [Streptomyces calvus]MBA8944354.1 pimeloyl-ACP methyl ester carboxylesterase [Streptomyces calvus]GGP55004.1 esterase [Streptomyces calvus]